MSVNADEYYLIDGARWQELQPKKVYSSSFAYIGEKFTGKNIKIFVETDHSREPGSP